MEYNKKQADKILSDVAMGKRRKSKDTKLEASARYLGVVKPKKAW